jgi:hypothetical protein
LLVQILSMAGLHKTAKGSFPNFQHALLTLIGFQGPLSELSHQSFPWKVCAGLPLQNQSIISPVVISFHLKPSVGGLRAPIPRAKFPNLAQQFF